MRNDLSLNELALVVVLIAAGISVCAILAFIVGSETNKLINDVVYNIVTAVAVL
jgi:hypothetical protein